MPLTVEIVTAERVVRTEQGVDSLTVPGGDGQLTILPRHAALMTPSRCPAGSWRCARTV